MSEQTVTASLALELDGRVGSKLWRDFDKSRDKLIDTFDTGSFTFDCS